MACCPTSTLACLPLGLFDVLQVEEQRWDNLVHVLWVPDIGLQLVIHRLPHHPLQPFDAGHSDPGGNRVRWGREALKP